tara:strand:+ start:67 stop:342 length:276 start_codon:yes stop_codon:yes gene_type:complete
VSDTYQKALKPFKNSQKRLIRNAKVRSSTLLDSTIPFNPNFKGLNVLQPDSLFLFAHEKSNQLCRAQAISVDRKATVANSRQQISKLKMNH